MVYDSLQGYLEAQLKVATNITPELIKQLKAEWRKDYVSRYNTQYRDGNVQITFRLSKAQNKKLLNMATAHQLKPTVYCRQLVMDALNGNASQDIQPLRLLLMELMDSIEEVQHEKQVLDADVIQSHVQKMLNIISW